MNEQYVYLYAILKKSDKADDVGVFTNNRSLISTEFNRYLIKSLTNNTNDKRRKK